jgi:hypothetical protein
MGAIHAAKHTRTIAIVLTPVDDPVQAGVVTSLTRPGGNMTRLSFWGPELNRQRLELREEAIQSFRSTCYVFACCFRGCTNVPAVSEAFVVAIRSMARFDRSAANVLWFHPEVPMSGLFSQHRRRACHGAGRVLSTSDAAVGSAML